jgi:hypothetical protein
MKPNAKTKGMMIDQIILAVVVAVSALAISYTTWEGSLFHSIAKRIGFVGKALQCPVCLAGWGGFVTGVAVFGLAGLVVGLIAMGINVILTTFMYKGND